MTIDKFNINSIAVIGGGPSGIASVYEFLHTTKDGKSTVGGSNAENPAFTKVVGFEQKNKVGGSWAPSIEVPDLPEDELWGRNYYDADVIHPKVEIPKGLSNHSVESPLVTDGVNNDNQWRRSAVYPGLYTNVPRRFLRFSSIKYTPPSKLAEIDPLISYKEVGQVLDKFVDDNKLLDHFRLNTQVQDVQKDEEGKWLLTLRHSTPEGKDEWYTEKFDAVVIASGHYSVPFIPYIEGLNSAPKGTIVHSKSFRTVDQFKDKNVLVVGSSLSGIDIIQYIEPVVKSLTISRTPGKQEIFPWITKAATSFSNKPRISKIDGKTVFFEDGSKLEDVDKILFATGYHWHYPYIGEKFLELTKPGYANKATGGSRVKGLYRDTFNIEDPTLAFIGVQITSVQFHSFEAGAVGIAGVWSNSKRLPSKDAQKEWETKRLVETSDDYIFHYYPWDIVQKEFIDVLLEYAPDDRPYILEGEDFGDYPKALEAAERAFYDIKAGKYSLD
ncbi:hypothetical protein WICANDRAFT_82601 [Wickerhamomyces anomalus NRRL Y-366-8]|uniref:FAD/NAD(P)-binding domain-containing protein n=1 Tax=Wickerhamomyces anomalus (strain ATCC 58044 / CBS 1984 / NCYC 433 / NRRL Y-366-8) TaxID=683960 RepID=A0A1E3PB17_WICAA|nr:uncharacterized protein WICANDRAFT_82601 [Wickerhamomyces anomalus NRRL Y-366-8]ODQ62609.1 hypothetical protein WICANDRAFT_82601 [Wickerhamomyces anomalus NRRL Y-366-8]